VLLAGKATSTLVVAILLLSVTMAVGVLGFGVPITGSVVLLLLASGAVAVLSVAVGLVVATLAVNEARARTLSILTILALSMLGGLWMPSFLLPPWVRRVAEALPTSWALRALEGVTWRHLSGHEVAAAAGMVYVVSGLLLVLAAWRFTRMERSPASGVRT
jgi:ABC-2 type transport system permease protein